MRHRYQASALIIMLLGIYCFFQLVTIFAAPGDLDTTFAGTGKTRTRFGLVEDNGRAVAIQGDGKIVVAGYSIIGSDNNYDFAVVRYNPNGSLDTSFGEGGIVSTPVGAGIDKAYAVALQGDGKIVVAGASFIGSSYDFAVARYNPNGSLDPTFSGDGKLTTAIGTGLDEAKAVALQGDGKIVAAGSSSISGFADAFAVVRYNTNGTLDTSFNNGGIVTTDIGGAEAANAIVLQGDGKLVLAGFSGASPNFDFAVVRYNTNGSLDDGGPGDSTPGDVFGSGGKVTTPIGSGEDIADAIAVQGDGKIVVAGYIDIGNFNYDFALVRYNPDGTLDNSFGVNGKVTTPIGSGHDRAYDVALQADDKIVLTGESYNGTNFDFAVVRYNADGSLDTSFDIDGKVTTPIGDYEQAYAVALQGDGKIVVAGASSIGSNKDIAVVRYNPDGSLDTLFDGGKLTTPVGADNDQGNGVALQADGKILIAGQSYNGINFDFAVVRYNADGSLDTSFSGDGKLTTPVGAGDDVALAVALQADGRIVVVGYVGSFPNHDIAVARYNADGSLDTSFDGDGKLTTQIGTGSDLAFAVALQADGRIVIAGQSFNGNFPDFAVVRYNADGSLDTTFSGDGKVTTAISAGNDYALAVALQGDGKIVVAGSAGGLFAVARYNSDGTLDPTFDADGIVTTPVGSFNEEACAVAVQADGKIIAAGRSSFDCAVVRYNPNGSLDTSFDTDGIVTTAVGQAYAVAIQSDGKIVVAGGGGDFVVVRYNPNGSLDTSFDGDGIVTTAIGTFNDAGKGLALQGDGKIVVAGYGFISNFDFAVARYNPNGSLDNSFGNTGAFDEDGKRTDDVGSPSAAARAVALQADGKIVVAGATIHDVFLRSFAVARYNTDGSLDDSFSGDGKVVTGATVGEVRTDFEGKAVALQADGKIVVAGSISLGPDYDFAVLRYNTDGSLDESFDGDGLVVTDFGDDDRANAIAIQPDGKIIIAGSSVFGFDTDFAVVRYNTDGSIDNSFNGEPIDIASFDSANAVAMQADDKIVVAGYAGSAGFVAVVRLNSNGSLDTSFDGDGKVTTALGTGDNVANAVAIQSDAKIVLAGYSTNGSNLDIAVVRYNPNGSLDATFDTDGKVTTPIGSGSTGNAVALQSDAKIVVSGSSFNGANNDFAVVRYNPDGSLDTSFDTDGKVVVDFSNGSNDLGNGVALDSSDRAVVVGEAGGLFGVVRILGDIQVGCNYSLSPASDYLSARGGPCSFNVTVGAGCAWTAQTSDSWIVITSDPAGTGNGSVSLEIRDNFATSARLGTVTIGSETFTVVQQGRGTVCSYTISPLFAAYQVGGGSGSFSISTSAACGWQAVSNQSWIEITSTEVGIGGGTINYTVSTNTTGAVRDGAIVVGGQSLKVKQKGS